MSLAVVLGSAAGAMNDLTAAKLFLKQHGHDLRVICVNGAVRICPVKPAAFCTVFTPADAVERFLSGIDLNGVPLFSRRGERGRFNVVKPKWHGSSGLYGVQIALEEMGFAGVILAGCPLDAAGGTLCPHSEMNEAHKVDRFKPWWLKALPVIGQRVRSMSGWTQELLGAPTEEWLGSLTPPEAVAAQY